MPDREKVIKALECCLGTQDCDVEPNEECPYNGMFLCATALHFDVMELLEEQEPVPPIRINTNHEQSWKCGKCGALINTFFKYCHECGQAVKWA